MIGSWMAEGDRGAFSLETTASGLVLAKAGEPHGVSLRAADLERRVKQGRKSLLARACDARPGTTVFDAMAGFGLDGLTLARLGCEVTLCERDPMVFELLEDGVRRCASDLLTAGHIHLVQADAADALGQPPGTDVVYLDPMFEPRSKSALPNKRAAFLLALLGSGEPLDTLLNLARRSARTRVVIKRRRHDAPVATPDFQLKGRSVRFDVYQAAP